MVHAVIKRDIVGEAVQIAPLGLRRSQSTRHLTNPVYPLAFLPHAFRRGVGAHAAARRPNDNEGFAFVFCDIHNGHIVRLNELAFVDHVLEPRVNFIRWHARRNAMPRRILANANDEISSAPVINIIGKRANSLKRRLRIPRLFELNAGIFHDITLDQGFYACRKPHGISLSLSRCLRMIV